MLTPSQIEKLECYHYGSLSAEERIALEKELQADAAFAQEAEAYEQLFDGFKALEAEAFQQQMQQWEQSAPKIDIVGTTTQTAKVVALSPRKQRRRILAMAAGFALLLLGGVAAFYVSTAAEADSSHSLYASYFEPADITEDVSFSPQRSVSMETEPTTETEIAELLQHGMQAYRAENYAGAIKDFEAYLDLKSSSSVEYFLGIAYLANGNTPHAKRIFRSISKKQNSLYKDGAEWYLGLTLLKEKNLKRADKVLMRIAEDDKHAHHGDAKALLQRIEALKAQ